MRIKKGDTVKILSGKDRGKTGKVVAVFTDVNRVTVDGVNVYAKRVRPKKRNQKGEIVHLPRPVHVSNVLVVCSNCKAATRVGARTEGNKKVRFCKKCGATVS